MELASARLVRPHQTARQSSLGVAMHIRCHALVRSDAVVQVQANHAGAKGRMHRSSVIYLISTASLRVESTRAPWCCRADC
jgi:hypothetical protein